MLPVKNTESFTMSLLPLCIFDLTTFTVIEWLPYEYAVNNKRKEQKGKGIISCTLCKHYCIVTQIPSEREEKGAQVNLLICLCEKLTFLSD